MEDDENGKNIRINACKRMTADFVKWIAIGFRVVVNSYHFQKLLVVYIAEARRVDIRNPC